MTVLSWKEKASQIFVKNTEHPVPGASFHLCCRLVAGIQPGDFIAHTESHGCLLIFALQCVLGLQDLGLSSVADLPVDPLQRVTLTAKLS